MMKRDDGQTKKLHDVNWGTFDHASNAPHSHLRKNSTEFFLKYLTQNLISQLFTLSMYFIIIHKKAL